MDHERRDAEGKALVDHKVTRVGEHALVQPRDVAEQVVEARAGHAACGVHVHAVKALHDLGVVGNFKIRRLRLAEALHLDVIAVVRTDGHAGVDDVRDLQHILVQLLLVLDLQLFQLCQTLRVGLDLGLDGLSLFELARVLLGLPHQHTDLLAQRVALRAQLARLGDGGALLFIQLQHLVHEGELGVLKLFLDIFPHKLGVFTNKSNIQHDFLPRYHNVV